MPSMSSPARRRTQAERTASTRAKLLDATIECLVEFGYEATTSRVVTDRAGVSRGAQTHHFPRRMDLIVGAVDEIAQRQIENWARESEALPEGGPRLRGALDLLWQEFNGPLALAGWKLWVAANDDEELYAAMAPVGKRISRSFRQRLRELFGDLADKDFERRVFVAVNSIRGLAFMRAFEPVEQQRADPWPAHRRALEQMLNG